MLGGITPGNVWFQGILLSGKENSLGTSVFVDATVRVGFVATGFTVVASEIRSNLYC